MQTRSFRMIMTRIVCSGWVVCGIIGCQTAGQGTRDVVTDQVMSAPTSPNLPPAESAPAHPQPGFHQEPTQSQSP